MKLPLTLITLGGLALASYAQFNPGNLAVVRISNSASQTGLSSSGNNVFLDQFTTSGSAVNSLNLTSNQQGAGANFSLTSNAVEGQLSTSLDNQHFVLIGYNGAPGSTASSSTVARNVLTVDQSASVSAGATSSFSGGNPSSTVSDGTGFWSVGSKGGVVYQSSLGGAETMVGQITGTSAAKSLAIAGGNLYCDNYGSSGYGLYQVGSGLPTSTGNSVFQIINTNGIGTGTPVDGAFVFNPLGSAVYIADGRTGANGGGVQKWVNTGGSWTYDYTLQISSTVGAKGLAVDFSGANAVVYATSFSGATGNGNSLVAATDTGAGAAFTTLATAGTNESFRGVQLTPNAVPEPTSMTLLGLGAAALLRRRKKA